MKNQYPKFVLEYQQTRLKQLYLAALLCLALVNAFCFIFDFDRSIPYVSSAFLIFSTTYFLIKKHTKLAFYIMIFSLMSLVQIVFWTGVGNKAAVVLVIPILLILPLFFNHRILFGLMYFISVITILLNALMYDFGILTQIQESSNLGRALVIASLITVFSIFLYFYYMDIKEVVFSLRKEKTRLIESKKSFTQILHHDPLTQLADRQLACDFFEHAISLTKNHGLIALCYLDIDQFKQINESYGREYGDQLIRVVSQLLSKQLGKGEGAFKLGIDEFLIIMPNFKNKGQLIQRLKAIQNSLSQLYIYEDKSINLSTSLGISLTPKDGNDFSAMLSRADIAVNEAKKKGGNCIEFFEYEMLEQQAKSFSLIYQIETYLQAKSIYLKYHPIIDRASNQIVGLKVSLNWNHLEYGTLQDNQILDTLSNSGKNNKIWSWSVMQVKNLMLSIMQQGFYDIEVHLVVPKEIILNGNCLSILTNLWANNDIPYSKLVLLIDGSEFLNAKVKMIQNMNALHMYGIKFAINNFGHNFIGFDRFKGHLIDRVFISPELIDSNTSNKMWVEVLLKLFRELNIQAVIELGKNQKNAMKSMSKERGLYVDHSKEFVNSQEVVHYLFHNNKDVYYDHI